MTSLIKICGLSTPETLATALDEGADMVGFVRFARSPRHVGLDLGRQLSRMANGRAERVLLVVDPDDRDLDEALLAIEPDVIQLHGAETPERVDAVRARSGRPVMKAVGIASAADLSAVERYRGAADRILLDAKPPRGSDRPGGNGALFDWRLLDGLAGRGALDPGLELVLSGGLTPQNVAEAVARTGLRAVDVSSGVETQPGEKDPARIGAFMRAARAAFAAAEQSRRVA